MTASRFLAFWTIALALPVAGQDSFEKRMRERAAADIHRYHAMLEAYAAGDEAASVDAVLAWDQERITRALEQINGPNDPVASWNRRLHGLAAMLHTDAALRIDPDVKTKEAFWHLDVASKLLATGMRERPEELRLLSERWYFTLTRYLRSGSGVVQADSLLALARERLPDDPVVLYESGTLAELFATDYAMARSQATVSRARLTFALTENGRRRTGELNQAANWLRQAATLNPSDDMLRLHLGRVQAVRREDAEALRILSDVLGQTKDAGTAYLAALFIAGVRERQSRLLDAAAAYRVAIARFPRGHAAYIGLSEVLQRAGQGDEARAVLSSLLSERFGPTSEPQRLYLWDPPGVAEERLLELRREVRQ